MFFMLWSAWNFVIWEAVMEQGWNVDYGVDNGSAHMAL